MAQNDLLDILEEEEANVLIPEYTYATFKSSRVINGQSIELTPHKELLFVIQHRFGKLNEGFYGLFGLDQSTIRLGFEYGLLNWLNIGVGRSSFKKTFDSYLKAKILRQQSGAREIPVTITLFSGVSLSTFKTRSELPEFYTSRLTYTHRILIARKFGNLISIQLSPSYVHRNLVDTRLDENDIYAIGFGGRYKLTSRMSINAEYFYQLNEYNKTKTFNSVALGIDLETGGHIFQIMLTNSKGMIDPYFIAATTGDISNGDIYIGFNIHRIFSFSSNTGHK